MRKSFLPLSLLLLAASCGQSGVEMMTRYHEDGRAKPSVAIASMIDTTTFECPWSLSEELTSMISSQVSKAGKLFVHSTLDSPFVENPFGHELTWMKREFQNEEFVVFMELVEHETAPALKHGKNPINLAPQEVSTNLNMAIRMRVIDLRGAAPKIVLQEIVRDSYYVPKTLIPTDYNQVVWGSEDYRKSPMGIAHIQLVQEISSRLTDYILLAKSR